MPRTSPEKPTETGWKMKRNPPSRSSLLLPSPRGSLQSLRIIFYLRFSRGKHRRELPRPIPGRARSAQRLHRSHMT
uniref:Uncharacterized protein n=1 Tax=Aegilops tauschii subsp. strangulata TaxID=200361 RepID=A0A453LYH4_AEGTS